MLWKPASIFLWKIRNYRYFWWWKIDQFLSRINFVIFDVTVKHVPNVCYVFFVHIYLYECRTLVAINKRREKFFSILYPLRIEEYFTNQRFSIRLHQIHQNSLFLPPVIYKILFIQESNLAAMFSFNCYEICTRSHPCKLQLSLQVCPVTLI